MKPFVPQGGTSVGRVNVTPLIDVVMCLVIFYLIVGQLVLEREAELRLPESRSGGPDEDIGDPLVINITGAEELLVDGVLIEAAHLVSVLEGRMLRDPRRLVQIRAGRDLRYGEVEPVVDACRTAGVRSVQLATERTP